MKILMAVVTSASQGRTRASAFVKVPLEVPIHSESGSQHALDMRQAQKMASRRPSLLPPHTRTCVLSRTHVCNCSHPHLVCSLPYPGVGEFQLWNPAPPAQWEISNIWESSCPPGAWSRNLALLEFLLFDSLSLANLQQGLPGVFPRATWKLFPASTSLLPS